MTKTESFGKEFSPNKSEQFRTLFSKQTVFHQKRYKTFFRLVWNSSETDFEMARNSSDSLGLIFNPKLLQYNIVICSYVVLVLKRKFLFITFFFKILCAKEF